MASEQRLRDDPGDDDERARAIHDKHKRILDDFAGRVLVRTAEGFHAKFLVTDAATQPRGFLFTCNLTAEALEHPELGVALTQDEARSFSRLFSWGFWEAAQHELLERKRLRDVVPLGRYQVPDLGADALCTAGAVTTVRAAAIELIESAQRRLTLATYNLEHDDVLRALRSRADSGVEVTLLVRPGRSKLWPSLRALRTAGARILGVAGIHAKAIAVDGKAGLICTANFEKRGLDSGFEAGLRLRGEDAAALDGILTEWIRGAAWQFLGHAKVGDVKGRVLHAADGAAKQTPVLVREGLTTVSLNRIQLSCLSQLQADRKLDVPSQDPALMPHTTKFVAEVSGPRLPKDATHVEKPQPVRGRIGTPPFPIYQVKGGRRVMLVERPEDIDRAVALMSDWSVTALVAPPASNGSVAR